jgi:hypothetical protein
VWSETGLGRTGEAVAYLENMARLEQSGKLVEDGNEAKWIVDSLQRIVNRDAPQEVSTRAESLIKAINERLMSQYPLGVKVPMGKESMWEELNAAGYMRAPRYERVEAEPEQHQEQTNTHDEMAATAGKLLERVADNTSDKFKNSQFLQLMRRLRDREVRVEDDKIVDVNTDQVSTSSTIPLHTQRQQQQQQTTPQQTTPQQTTPQQTTYQEATHQPIPAVDPTILSHADTDFAMPVYSDAQYASSPSTSDEPRMQ